MNGRGTVEPTTGVSRGSEESAVTSLVETSSKMKSVTSQLSPAACVLAGAELVERQGVKARSLRPRLVRALVSSLLCALSTAVTASHKLWKKIFK